MRAEPSSSNAVKPIACGVDGEEVVAQPGDCYGDWVASDIEGCSREHPVLWDGDEPLAAEQQA